MNAVMEAGFGLDALIAEKVMGWTTFISDYGIETNYYADPSKPPRTRAGNGKFANAGWQRPDGCIKPFNPSTSIAAAWPVLEKLRDLGVRLHLIQMEDGWLVGHDNDEGYIDPVKGVMDTSLFQQAEAPTAPLAICLAARKIVK